MNTFNAGFFQYVGGVSALADALRKQSQEQQRFHQKMQQSTAQDNHTEIRWYLAYIYRGNARFFNTIRITDAKWST